ncbi:MAG: asparagine synthase C-terminal domain-containing protein [Candidatus Paceibacterota bacterium]|jgi:asparagine synthase (glutamine-hydrolysing)
MLADFEKLEKPKKYDDNENKLKKELHDALDLAVRSSVSGAEKVAVAFSGGLDSSIMAYLVAKYSMPMLFCVGFKDSHDVINARKSAELLGFELNIISLEETDLGKYFARTVELVGTTDRLITDLNVPLYIILEEIGKHGFDKLVLGQGADTLFGGFARYPYSENFGDEILQDIKNIGKTNLVYNYKIFDNFKMKPIYPFLEKDVVDIAVKSDPGLKIRDGVQKYILRETFREYLPENIVDLPKKSFQYGSGIHKALRKFSKEN